MELDIVTQNDPVRPAFLPKVFCNQFPAYFLQPKIAMVNYRMDMENILINDKTYSITDAVTELCKLADKAEEAGFKNIKFYLIPDPHLKHNIGHARKIATSLADLGYGDGSFSTYGNENGFLVLRENSLQSFKR